MNAELRRGRLVDRCLVAGAMLVVAMAAGAVLRLATVGETLGAAATAWLDTLDEAGRARALRPFADAGRTDWHFVPKPERKGLPLAAMTPPQEKAALALVRAALSEAGYGKALAIMRLEELLRRLEGARAKNVRDERRYFLTIFGTPGPTGSWGLSVEGHHLSLNFTVRDGRLVDSSPQFMGTNPAVVRTTFPDLPAAGHRVLADEELLAFELVRSLDEGQRKLALLATEAPREIRAAGEPQPPPGPPAGIPFAKLTPDQQSLLRRLVEVYCATMPAEVAGERLRLVETPPAGVVHHGWDDVHFAWAGALEPGVGHAYRVEGPTFVIELANVMPDAEGNPANHVHCVWRDKTGDFR